MIVKSLTELWKENSGAPLQISIAAEILIPGRSGFAGCSKVS